MSARLPTPGGDAGNWGEILNQFLEVEHNDDGSLKSNGSLAGKASASDVTALTTRVSTSIAADGSLTTAATDQAVAAAQVDAKIADAVEDMDAALDGKQPVSAELTEAIALRHTHMGGLFPGWGRTRVGVDALPDGDSYSGHTAVGYKALSKTQTGSGNTAVGLQSMENGGGNNNTAVGVYALQNASGPTNVGIGVSAGKNITTSPNNVAIGASSMGVASYSIGSSNTAIGLASGPRANGVNSSVAVGASAITTANEAIAIGSSSTSNHAGSVAIGANTITTDTNQVMVGPRDVELTDSAKGLVLKSPDGSRWRMKIDNTGTVTTTKL